MERTIPTALARKNLASRLNIRSGASAAVIVRRETHRHDMIDNENAALKIIQLLDCRSGFDEWWSGITACDKKVVLVAIENIIWETHDSPWPKPKFVIVRCDDWEGLYKDGILIYQAHEVDIDIILAQMGLELEEWRADDFLDAYHQNTLPEKLSDVIKDA